MAVEARETRIREVLDIASHSIWSSSYGESRLGWDSILGELNGSKLGVEFGASGTSWYYIPAARLKETVEGCLRIGEEREPSCIVVQMKDGVDTWKVREELWNYMGEVVGEMVTYPDPVPFETDPAKTPVRKIFDEDGHQIVQL